MIASLPFTYGNPIGLKLLVPQKDIKIFLTNTGKVGT